MAGLKSQPLYTAWFVRNKRDSQHSIEGANMTVTRTSTRKGWAEAISSISLVAAGGFSLIVGEIIVHGVLHYVTHILEHRLPDWAELVPKVTLAISVTVFAVSVCVQDVIHLLRHTQHNHDTNAGADAVDQPSGEIAKTPNLGGDDTGAPVSTSELATNTRRLIAKSAVIIGLALAFTVMLPVTVLTIIYLGGGLVLVLVLCILAVLLGILFGLAVSENAQIESSADYARDVTMNLVFGAAAGAWPATAAVVIAASAVGGGNNNGSGTILRGLIGGGGRPGIPP